MDKVDDPELDLEAAQRHAMQLLQSLKANDVPVPASVDEAVFDAVDAAFRAGVRGVGGQARRSKVTSIVESRCQKLVPGFQHLPGLPRPTVPGKPTPARSGMDKYGKDQYLLALLFIDEALARARKTDTGKGGRPQEYPAKFQIVLFVMAKIIGFSYSGIRMMARKPDERRSTPSDAGIAQSIHAADALLRSIIIEKGIRSTGLVAALLALVRHAFSGRGSGAADPMPGAPEEYRGTPHHLTDVATVARSRRRRLRTALVVAAVAATCLCGGIFYAISALIDAASVHRNESVVLPTLGPPPSTALSAPDDAADTAVEAKAPNSVSARRGKGDAGSVIEGPAAPNDVEPQMYSMEFLLEPQAIEAVAKSEELWCHRGYGAGPPRFECDITKAECDREAGAVAAAEGSQERPCVRIPGGLAGAASIVVDCQRPTLDLLDSSTIPGAYEHLPHPCSRAVSLCHVRNAGPGLAVIKLAAESARSVYLRAYAEPVPAGPLDMTRGQFLGGPYLVLPGHALEAVVGATDCRDGIDVGAFQVVAYTPSGEVPRTGFWRNASEVPR